MHPSLYSSLRALRATVILALGTSPLGCSGLKGDPSTCRFSVAILDSSGMPTGYERCSNGNIHRVSAERTDAYTTIEGESCRGDEDDGRDCEVDADCTAGANGRCMHEESTNVPSPEVYESCSCVYSCASDADCAGVAGTVCEALQGGTSVCLPN